MQTTESKWDETIIVDVMHFREFTAGDRSLEREILQIFLEHVPHYIDVLKAIETDNWRAMAHKLKGAARSIGAWELACEAERAEEMDIAPAVGGADREKLISELERRFVRVNDYIKQNLMA